MKNHGHFYSGFVIMTIGILFLLGNLGLISWSVLGGLSQIWPLIIIAVGLNLFFNNHVIIKIITFTGLVVALVAAGMTYPQSDRWDFRFDFDFGDRFVQLQPIERVYAMEPAVTSAELNLKLAAGALNIDGQDINLLESRSPGNGGRETVDTRDGGTRKSFSVDNSAFVLGRPAGRDDNWTYRYRLNSRIPWDVRIDAGATEANLDFSNVILKNLELNSAAGDVEIRIGDVDRTATLAVDIKASDFEVVLPKNTGFRAVIRGAVHDISIEGNDYIMDGDVYTSTNYSTAAKKVDLNLDVAVGDIKIGFE
jgi:hypothetical protein